MNIKQIYLGLEKITPEGWELGFYIGVFFFKKEINNKIQVLTITYADYAPEYTFSSLVAKIKYLDVEDILEPLKIKYFNHDSREDIFSSTVKKGGGCFSDKYRFGGVSTMEDLEGFVEEVQEKIENFALPWLVENEELEQLGSKIRILPEDERETIKYFGGAYALYRKIIILHLLEDKSYYQKLKNKRIEGFKNLITNNKLEFLKYLEMLEELVEILEYRQTKEKHDIK